MKVGDPIWVMHGADDWREGVVSGAPEHGWVGVRGLSGRPGVVSVRVECVRTSPPSSALREERRSIEEAAHRGAADRVEREARALGLTREQVRRLRCAVLGAGGAS